MKIEKALVWFRRDLRDDDHAALHAALCDAQTVYCAFVFDTDILDHLRNKADRRVHFIRESLVELDKALKAKGGGLIVRIGRASKEIPELAKTLGTTAVYANRDYEPSAKRRDDEVRSALSKARIGFQTFKDQVIFESDEILSLEGKPYSVFTAYKNAWLKRLTAADYASQPSLGQFAAPNDGPVPSLSEIGFQPTNLIELGIAPGMAGARSLWKEFRELRLLHYGELRDFPAKKGVSYLSVHLRFGTISLRKLVREALARNAFPWLNELIWRDFYFMILDRYPHVATHAFKPEYDALKWAEWPEGFSAWCAGLTGYPLVDAAMRQLKHCGWMHNRLRMVVASFLTKDLGIDWRHGENYFAEQLNDFDLAANNGGWQWSASTGCDAQPYFRIFNPITQSEKFDPTGKFIRRYLPELAKVPDKYIHAPWKMSLRDQEALGILIGRDYPAPIVDHKAARELTLARYAAVKKGLLAGRPFPAD